MAFIFTRQSNMCCKTLIFKLNLGHVQLCMLWFFPCKISWCLIWTTNALKKISRPPQAFPRLVLPYSYVPLSSFKTYLTIFEAPLILKPFLGPLKPPKGLGIITSECTWRSPSNSLMLSNLFQDPPRPMQGQAPINSLLRHFARSPNKLSRPMHN